MGVPSFFRWLMKRYPHVVTDCVEEEHDESATAVPAQKMGPNPNGMEFDALYLDMNGIIHRASHPEDQPAPESEEAMMEAMFVFIDRLFAIVRPQKLLYIGIDGVAPRAKMNQQRSRRFLAAKHRLDEEANARSEADPNAPKEAPKSIIFDHNVITPGTEFMGRVAEALRTHFTKRIGSDPNWAQLAVVLSDACVPGEGEHKIMEFIRHQRRQEGYNPNAHIAVYGLDADLIFLTMAQHEPRFSILREEVSSVTCFVCHKVGHISTECPQLHPEEHEEDEEEEKQELTFQWVHTSLMREYLDREFHRLPLSFPYSLERVIDDFIVICFLAGNDFMPRLPSVAIHEGAIDTLIAAYKHHLPHLDGYICSNGNIDFKRLEPIVAFVAESEEAVLKERKKNFRRKQLQEKALLRELALQKEEEGEGKDDDDEYNDDEGAHGGSKHNHRGGKAKEAAGHKLVRYRRKEGASRSREDEAGEIEKELLDEDEEEEDLIRIGERGWRDRYLMQKFGVPTANHEFYQGVVRSYVEGLQWVARYYWQGCVSWKWFYPYHYPPMATMLADLIGKFRSAEVVSSFQLARPFHPFDQLMAVLPAASSHALPLPYRWLMTSAQSPIADFYPTKIDIDMDGVSHNFEWAGVVKLPFVDESRLLAAIQPLESQLSPDEVHRNSFGLPRLLVGPASPLHAAILCKLPPSATGSHQAQLSSAEGGGFMAGSVKLHVGDGDAKPGSLLALDYSLPELPAGWVEFASGLLPSVKLPEPCLLALEGREEGDGEEEEEYDYGPDDPRANRSRNGRGRGGRGRGRGGRRARGGRGGGGGGRHERGGGRDQGGDGRHHPQHHETTTHQSGGQRGGHQRGGGSHHRPHEI